MMKAVISFRSRALAVALILGASASSGAEVRKPKPAAAKSRGLPALFKNLKIEAPPPGSKVLPRHPVKLRRRLSYSGALREVKLARSGGRAVAISSKLYEIRRVNLVRPQLSGLVQVLAYDQQRLVAAEQAGRDNLALHRERPSRGARISAILRRGSARGLEPAAGDSYLQRRLAPLPEMPRLPAKQLLPGRPVTRISGEYMISWELTGAARLEERACWVLKREVRLKPGSNRSARPVTARSEYLVDARNFAVLGVVSSWTSLDTGGHLARERVLELKLSAETEPGAEEFEKESSRVEQVRALLRAVAARDVGRVERLLVSARAAHCPRAALALAQRYARAEKALATASGGARRIDLVPEDTFAFISAPEKIDPKAKLTPVVFLHGASAHAATYFKDWRGKVGDRPLLLIFPQSRGWTWNARSDGAVLGSLIDVLGRSYKLDRRKLVMVGHGAGGEMAMFMAYGASFPGYRVRGVSSAGALLAEHIRKQAYELKPPALLARLRSVDVFLLGGTRNKKVQPDKLRNLASWLRSYNPDGVSLMLTPKVALRYNADWTPHIIEWIEKLPPAALRPKAPRPRK
jgi:hypothetical protein